MFGSGPARRPPTPPPCGARCCWACRSGSTLTWATPISGQVTIASANHISVRYLHKLFHEEGTSVARWVRERRLDNCRRDLEDPALARRGVQAIARRWGFQDAAHFTRIFKASFGEPPGQYRRGELVGRHQPVWGMSRRSLSLLRIHRGVPRRGACGPPPASPSPSWRPLARRRIDRTPPGDASRGPGYRPRPRRRNGGPTARPGSRAWRVGVPARACTVAQLPGTVRQTTCGHLRRCCIARIGAQEATDVSHTDDNAQRPLPALRVVPG